MYDFAEGHKGIVDKPACDNDKLILSKYVTDSPHWPSSCAYKIVCMQLMKVSNAATPAIK